MKNYHLTTLLFTLFVCTANHAQITFDFTAGSFDGTTWTQTVEGVTCTATFDDDGTFLDVATLSGQNGKTFIDSSEGMYMGKYVEPPSAKHRTGFARPGARITFSQDVRLKSYTLVRIPSNTETYCYIVGGSVTAIASHGGEVELGNYTGERAFALESVVPASTTLAASVSSLVGNSVWRLSSLTVELEPYVEPVIPIPEGNETGVTRIAMAHSENFKFSFALKNGRLHYWSDNGWNILSRDFIFDGGESGVLDFWAVTGVQLDPLILLETVEGYVLFHSNTSPQFHIITPLGDSDTLPKNPDKVSIGLSSTAVYNDAGKSIPVFTAHVMMLKDGFIHIEGERADEFIAAMPAELSTGGVSEIAAGTYTALAVKDRKLYMWNVDSGVSFALYTAGIPEAVANGEVLHLAANGHNAVVQLTTGEVIQFGQSNEPLTAEQTSRELFADLRFENNHIIAIREDGSFLMQDKQVGVGVNRYEDYDGGAFYVEDQTTSNQDGTIDDFWLRGLETPPTIVQQLGYEQISFGHENVAALLPGGRMVLWGGLNVKSTNNLSAHPIQAETVPAQINEILFPQPDLWGTVPQNFYSPSQAQLQDLKDGTLEGIQWGGNGNPQYEVQTTSDINDDTSWESLPVGTDPELRYYRIKEITQDTQ